MKHWSNCQILEAEIVKMSISHERKRNTALSMVLAAACVLGDFILGITGGVLLRQLLIIIIRQLTALDPQGDPQVILEGPQIILGDSQMFSLM